jgi:hypothetical protein
MQSSQLQDLIVSKLALEHGGTKRRWRIAVGPIKLHSSATHAHCNWSVAPSGTPRENSQIERLMDDLRLAHPVVSAG